MGCTCSVPGCTSNYRSNKEVSVSTFAFPSDNEKRYIWIHAIHRANFKPTTYASVCIKYFSENHIKKKARPVSRAKPKLTDDAVPLYFLGRYPVCHNQYLPNARRKDRGYITEQTFKTWSEDNKIPDFDDLLAGRAMAPKYKLTYFNLRGVGEPIRFLFLYGGIEFEDIRVELEDWPKVKDSTPYGKLPYLDVDGKRITQSTAIARYVAKLVGLAGRDDLEALEIDSAVDTIVDLKNVLVEYLFEKDEAVKQRKKEIAVKETVPYFLSKLDARLKENGGYFVGDKLTWADVYFGAAHETIDDIVGEKVVHKYPHLQALADKVHAFPAIKAWVAKRPLTCR